MVVFEMDFEIKLFSEEGKVAELAKGNPDPPIKIKIKLDGGAA